MDTETEFWIRRASYWELQTVKLVKALNAVLADISDYERINHLHPNPGHKDCWQSVTNAKEVLEALK
jgi:hypothetical protein